MLINKVFSEVTNLGMVVIAVMYSFCVDSLDQNSVWWIHP